MPAQRITMRRIREVLRLKHECGLSYGEIGAVLSLPEEQAVVLRKNFFEDKPHNEIAAQIADKTFEWLDAPMLRVTAIDTPVPYSPPLEDYFLPQIDDIVTAARYLVAY